MFKYSAQQLSELFDQDNIKDGKSLETIKQWGKLEGLAETLRTNLKKGTSDSQQTQVQRKTFYGDNKPIIKPPKTIWDLILENFEDQMLRVLCIAAIISLVLGIASEGIKKGWMEGTSILVAVVIIISVTAGNNYIKERQFQKLNQDATKKSLLVRRGNLDIRIDSSQLVVGDIQLLQTGQIASVDGILVQSNLLVTDQSAMTGQPKQIKKDVAVTFEAAQNINPFIVSGSKVLQGTGKMLVLAVGEHSQYGKLKKALVGADDQTPLQQKLSILANQIGHVGTICAGATFLCLLGHIVYGIYRKFATDGQLIAHIFTAHILSEIVQSFIVAISIIVVSVPEGLPLAVTIALAYSVGKMKDENNLVRYLQACQTMGGVDNICSDKTGTLTKNRMNVTRAFIWKQDVADKDIKKVINQPFAELLSQSICQNSNATPVFTRKQDGSIFSQQNGNKTQCALLQMAFKLGFSYLQQRNQNNQLAVFPFSSKNKWMTSLCVYKGNKYVFTKGAPDFLLPHCSKYYDSEGNIQDITPQYTNELKSTIQKYANDTLRTLLLTCKQFDVANFKTDVEANENLAIMCLVGIKDPIRDEIPHAVESCHTAGVTVRMITGDNKNTAVAIAKQAGILPKDWQSKGADDLTVMLGKDFRAFVDGIKHQGTHQQSVGNIQNFKKVAKSLKVLARSSPTDKYIMATGLKQLDHVVAMTGDGTNDAPALKKADIGFAMGIAGTQVAKQAAGIILLDDNFKSIVTAMKWGRNIFDSIRKFLQFQLTVNVVALVLAFTGAAVLKESPLNPIQMLWINLIMDTLASLALATEPPSDQLLLRKPYSRFEGLITADMWKNIISQSILQIIILGTILFKGPQIFGIPSSFGQKQWNYTNGKHLCLFFHTFVLLQIFNQINARKLKSSQINVFKNYFNNYLFHLIMLLTILIQILCIQFGGQSLKAVPLTPNQHLICIGLGLSSIFMGVIFKLIIPASLFTFLVKSEKKQKEQ